MEKMYRPGSLADIAPALRYLQGKSPMPAAVFACVD
jgi:hypothetical protein